MFDIFLVFGFVNTQLESDLLNEWFACVEGVSMISGWLIGSRSGGLLHLNGNGLHSLVLLYMG